MFFRAVIPLCTAHQSYDTVTVTAVEVGPGEAECSFAGFHSKEENNFTADIAKLKPCSADIGCYQSNNSSNLLGNQISTYFD